MNMRKITNRVWDVTIQLDDHQTAELCTGDGSIEPFVNFMDSKGKVRFTVLVSYLDQLLIDVHRELNRQT